MHTVFDVANWFLARAENVTNKKLQKLVYYAYAWYIVFFNDSPNHIENRLFNNRIEAWIHGAVCPDLYSRYRVYGSSEIPRYTGQLTDFSVDEFDVLNQVLNIYGLFNGDELEAICTTESPWLVARGETPAWDASTETIDDAVIFRFYDSKLGCTI